MPRPQLVGTNIDTSRCFPKWKTDGGGWEQAYYGTGNLDFRPSRMLTQPDNEPANNTLSDSTSLSVRGYACLLSACDFIRFPFVYVL